MYKLVTKIEAKENLTLLATFADGEVVSFDVKTLFERYRTKDDSIIEQLKEVITAEKLMDLYSFHHKFQTKEYINKCNQVWSDE